MDSSFKTSDLNAFPQTVTFNKHSTYSAPGEEKRKKITECKNMLNNNSNNKNCTIYTDYKTTRTTTTKIQNKTRQNNKTQYMKCECFMEQVSNKRSQVLVDLPTHIVNSS